MREIVISKNEAGQRLNKLVMKYLNKAPSSFVYRMIITARRLEMRSCMLGM